MRVENLTLRGGAVPDQGGNLQVMSSQAVMSDCVIEDGHAPRGGGVWIFGASAPRFERCVFRNNNADLDGGAVLHESGAPLFVDCDFVGNIAVERGGGIRVDADTVRLEDCRFELNYGDVTGGGVDFAGRLELDGCHFLHNSGGSFFFYIGGGAGLHGEAGELLCENTTFEGNYGGEYGGAILLDGEASTTILDCLFLDNYSRYDGAITIIEPQSPTLERLTFIGNGDVTVRFDGDQSSDPVRLRDCLFHDNGAYAGLVVSFWADLILDGCTLVENGHSNFGFLRSYYSTLTLYGTLIADNEMGELVPADVLSGLSVVCTNIHGNADGDWTGPLAGFADINDNLSADPYFCDAPAADFTLEAHSPCLPANNDCGALIGALGEGCEAVTPVDGATPGMTRLVGVSPNPFNPSTRVDFSLASPGRVKLTIFDVAGRRVRTLLDEHRAAGHHDLEWNGRDDSGRRLASGVYFYRLEAGDFRAADKLVMVQ